MASGICLYSSLKNIIKILGTVTALAFLYACGGSSSDSERTYDSFIYTLAADGRPCSSPYPMDVVQGYLGFDLLHPNGFKSYGCQIVSSATGHPVRSGTESIRFEVRDGDCSSSSTFDDCANDRSRHELFQKTSNQSDGDEDWYHFSIYVPDKPLVMGSAVTFLGQFQQSNGVAPLMFEDFDSGYGFRQNDANNNWLYRDTILNNASYRDQWTDVLLHIKWSSVADGFIDVYINGNLVESLTGANIQIGGQTTNFHFGIYNAFISRCNCSVMPRQIVYFDEIRKGATRGSVEL